MELPKPGDVFLGRYQLEAELGAGGFATVLLGIETSLGRRVALKILRPQGTGYPGGMESRFEREVKVLAGLSDPHTVRLLDWGRAPDGLLYMVFEYVHGEDLAKLLDRVGRLDERTTVAILRQILKSLREAHHAGILHRDIKPENIRIYEYDGDPWRAKLLDFGIAKPVRGAAEITTKGALIGSPRYMSPEQLYDHELTPASDLYSLGLVTFEMLMGREALAMNSLAAQVLRLGEPGQLAIPEHVASPRLRAVLERMLTREPARRFQTADQILAVLEPTASVSQPNPLPLLRPSEPTQPAATTTPSLVPLFTILTLIMFAVGAAGGVVLMLTASDDEPTTAEPALPTKRVPSALLTAPTTPQAPAPTLTVERIVADAGPQAGHDAGTPRNPASAGCGKAPPFVGDGTLRALDGFTSVTWHTYVPIDYDPNTAHPVLFFFHEDAETPAAGLDLTGFRKYANQHHTVIIALHDPALWSWDGVEKLAAAPTALETTRDTLCIDPQRTFAFGHGNGGRAVERLHCVVDNLTATAASAHRMTVSDAFCTPIKPVPYLHIAPIADGYDPVSGGSKCGKAKLSLAEMEQRWRERNGCSGKSRPAPSPRHDDCRTWSCDDAPFVSCHVQGGHRWPGQGTRTADLQRCDGPPMRFPIADAVWDFFDSVSGRKPDQR